MKEKEVKEEEEAAGGGRCSCSRVMGWEGPPPSLPPSASLVIKTFSTYIFKRYLLVSS